MLLLIARTAVQLVRETEVHFCYIVQIVQISKVTIFGLPTLNETHISVYLYDLYDLYHLYVNVCVLRTWLTQITMILQQYCF